MATDATIKLFDDARQKRCEAARVGADACESYLGQTPEQRTGDPDHDPKFVAALELLYLAETALNNLDFKTTD